MAEVVHGIETDPDRCGGEPTIAGTRLTVRTVGRRIERTDTTPEEFAEAFSVTLSEVYRALAYYYEHPDEMAEWDQWDEDLEREFADDTETMSDLRERLG